jgi:DNA repair exonuclease SbcCD nuclease subunit
MDKIKILLISDLHLGIESVNPLISGEERLSTFRRIISLAQKHDILLIAGDLIHDGNIDAEYYNILKNEFSSLLDGGVEIFYTPGPGELNPKGKIYPAVLEINTTYTFSDNKDESVIKSSKGNIFIYGLQCRSSQNGWNISRKEPEGFHIGLFHADFNPQINEASDAMCIKKDDIKKMNMDFYALGKNHNFKMFRFSNRILGAYPGSPEPCSIDETGDRFAVSMEIDKNVLLTIKRIAVNTIKILSDEIDCSTIINQNILFDKIKSTYPENSIVNILLTGERDFIIENNFKTELSEYFRGLKITDISLPTLKIMIDENIKNPSLEGIFFQILNQRINGDGKGKIKNEILAGIINEKQIRGRSEGAILCDF